MTLLRTALVVVAVITACVLFQEIRLWIVCSDTVELRASDVKNDARWRSGAPMWALLREAATPQPPFAITSDAGTPNGACLVFTSPEDSRTVLAVLLCPNVREARAFYRRQGNVDIEAFAYAPPPKTKGFLEEHLRRAGLLFPATFRILDMEGGPIGLAGTVCLALLTALLLFPYIASRFHLRLHFLDAAWKRVAPFLHTRFEWPATPRHVEQQVEYVSEAPLPEEVKVRVQGMMSEAWDTANSTE